MLSIYFYSAELRNLLWNLGCFIANIEKTHTIKNVLPLIIGVFCSGLILVFAMILQCVYCVNSSFQKLIPIVPGDVVVLQIQGKIRSYNIIKQLVLTHVLYRGKRLFFFKENSRNPFISPVEWTPFFSGKLTFCHKSQNLQTVYAIYPTDQRIAWERILEDIQPNLPPNNGILCTVSMRDNDISFTNPPFYCQIVLIKIKLFVSKPNKIFQFVFSASCPSQTKKNTTSTSM